MAQNEVARLGTLYENQSFQEDPRENKPTSFIVSAQVQQPAPAQDPAHTHLPVSQYNAHLLQGPERKPAHHLLSTIQNKESPQFSLQQPPLVTKHLPTSTSQVGHNFRENVAQPTVTGQVGQGFRQNV